MQFHDGRMQEDAADDTVIDVAPLLSRGDTLAEKAASFVRTDSTPYLRPCIDAA